MGETVLIKPNSQARASKKVYHRVDPDNPEEPLCKRDGGVGYIPKDVDLLPHHRECKVCSGEHTPTGGTGPQLCNILEQMDPEEVL